MENYLKIKKNKFKLTTLGFTLVELLAVIVIVGIIALITIPKVKDSINDSRKKTVESSALNYARTIDQYVLHEESNKNLINLNGEYSINEEGNLDGLGNTYELDYTGQKPTSGTLEYQDNKLLSGCLVINGYEVEYQNDKFTSNGKGICGILPKITKYFTYDGNAENNLQFGHITEMKNQPDLSWNYYLKVTAGGKKGYTIESMNAYTEQNTLEQCEHFRTNNFDECVLIDGKYRVKSYNGKYKTLQECEQYISNNYTQEQIEQHHYSCKEIDDELVNSIDFNATISSEICGVFSNETVCMNLSEFYSSNFDNYIQIKRGEYERTGASCSTYGVEYLTCGSTNVVCSIALKDKRVTCFNAPDTGKDGCGFSFGKSQCR